MSTTAFQFNLVTFGLPVESYRVDAYVTKDERLPVVTEYVLRLLRVCGDITITSARDYFGFTDAEALAIVESLSRQGLVNVVGESLSLSPYANERFEESSSDDYPRFTKVELRRDTVAFDLLSFSPLDSRSIGPISQTSYRLSATNEALKNSLERAEAAYFRGFADLTKLQGETGREELSVYSVEDITSKKRGYLPVPVTFMLADEEQVERALPALFEDGAPPELTSAFHEAVSTAISAPLTVANHYIDRFIDLFGVSWLGQYLTGKRFSIHRFASDVAAGGVVTPKDVVPLFGNLYLPGNLNRVTTQIEKLRRDRQSRLQNCAAWISSGNMLWGRGDVFHQALVGLKNSLGLVTADDLHVFWATESGQEAAMSRNLEGLSAARHHAFRPAQHGDPTLGSRLELFLYPTGFAVALFHLSLPGNQGLWAPVGFMTSRHADVEHIHKLIVEVAGDTSYLGPLVQGARSSGGSQEFNVGCGFLKYSDYRPRAIEAGGFAS